MIQHANLPAHVGIIMDGNGRWAKKRGLPRKMGHKAGAATFKDIARYANKIGLKYLTTYVFSTENWKRPKEEVNSIIELLRSYLNEMDGYARENIRVRFIGDRSVFDDDIRAKMQRAEEKSRDATGLTLILAINYRADLEHGSCLATSPSSEPSCHRDWSHPFLYPCFPGLGLGHRRGSISL